MDAGVNMQVAGQAELAAIPELQKPLTAVIEQPSTGNVDIRDILFGSQMRYYENRFARLEETRTKETTTDISTAIAPWLKNEFPMRDAEA